jgi:hypothetical protein
MDAATQRPHIVGRRGSSIRYRDEFAGLPKHLLGFLGHLGAGEIIAILKVLIGDAQIAIALP